MYNMVKEWCKETNVDTEHVSEEQWSQLYHVLNDLASHDTNENKQDDSDEKEKEHKQALEAEVKAKRLEQLLQAGWITSEQWKTISERYCEMGWHEINTSEIIPSLESKLTEVAKVVSSNDPDQWKKLMKEANEKGEENSVKQTGLKNNRFLSKFSYAHPRPAQRLEAMQKMTYVERSLQRFDREENDREK
jgi:cytochrome c551/c552